MLYTTLVTQASQSLLNLDFESLPYRYSCVVRVGSTYTHEVSRSLPNNNAGDERWGVKDRVSRIFKPPQPRMNSVPKKKQCTYWYAVLHCRRVGFSCSRRQFGSIIVLYRISILFLVTVTMMFSLKTLLVVTCTSLFASVDAFPTGAGSCVGGEAAVMGGHVTPADGKTIVTGSLADGGVALLLNGSPLVPGTAVDFGVGTSSPQFLTLAGSSDFRGLLVRLSAPDGVDTTNSLIEQSDDLRSADNVCTAPVVGITHANRNLKNQQAMGLSIGVVTEVTLDVTVVFANNSTDSIYYFSSYTLNSVDDAPAFPSCSVCGGTKVVTLTDVIVTNPLDGTMPSCAEIQAGGLAGVVSPQFCVLLPGAISTTCGCEEPDSGGGTMTMAPTSGPTMESDEDSGAVGVMIGQSLVTLVAAAAMALW
jgi:hypothetical protein